MTTYVSVGFYNGNIGPWLYVERGGFLLHFYARYFRDPWDRGFRWGLSLHVRHRYVLRRSSPVKVERVRQAIG